ncbi:MAG: hypothetical protein BGO41_10830 [Clostridiales bacterium 38-18]|nr:MAG: hypothetical protein BGO41_10830 [Clostridiales bacterium 38-18]
MTFKIILAVVIGGIVGLFVPDSWYALSDNWLTVGLCLLLFFVGIDIGKNKNVLKDLKRSGALFFLIPIGVAVGSLIGAFIIGALLGYPLHESGAIGSGLGWYTLSSIIIAPYSAELSVLAFLTNVVREILAIMMIPLVAKYVGFYEAIAPAGATAMDTTLPIVSRNTNSETAVLSFSTGLILSTLVPILVPLFLR